MGRGKIPKSYFDKFSRHFRQFGKIYFILFRPHYYSGRLAGRIGEIDTKTNSVQFNWIWDWAWQQVLEDLGMVLYFPTSVPNLPDEDLNQEIQDLWLRDTAQSIYGSLVKELLRLE